MQKVKKVLLNTWVISIFSPIVTAIIISGFTALIKQINFFEALKLLFSWIVKAITFRIPLYAIVLVVMFLIMVLKVYIKIEDAKESNLPKWLSYTKAHYKDWVLKWEYQLGYDNKYEIEKLRPICQCGCELSQKSNHNNTYYTSRRPICPNCENIYPPIDSSVLEDFEKILIHNINTENYPQDL